MRNTLVATALLLACAACGGGDGKEEFQRYESAVQPLLREEHELRTRLLEVERDAEVYWADAELPRFVKKKLLPFYDRLIEQAGAVATEDPALRGIHAVLLDYAKARRGLCDLQLELDRLTRKGLEVSEPVVARVDAAKNDLTPYVEALNAASRNAPELVARLAPRLQQETRLGREFYGLLEGLRRRRLEPAEFLKALDQRFLPFYADTRKLLEGLTVEGDEKAFVDAVFAYLGAVENVLEISRSVAHARVGVERKLGPVAAKIEAEKEKADALLREYRERAGAHRENLR